MRNRVSAIRSQVLGLLVLLSLASPAALAAAPKNPYDEYRDRTYSNKGLANEQEEMQLGAQVHQQVLQKYRLVQDPEVNGYVQQLGERIARTSRRPDLPYRFFVIDDRSVNAFALPGGYVYVNRGLIDIAQGEDELAAAIAHEVAHVVARHGLQNVKKAQRTALLFGILGIGAEIATGGSGTGRAARAASELFAAGIITKYGRDFEREADYLGLHNMVSAGYAPDGMLRIFQRLEQNASRAKSPTGGIFASHPNAGERVRNTQTEISQRLGGSTASTRSADGSTRARRAGNRPSQQTAYASNNGNFARMKQVLGGYSGGGYYGNQPASYPNNRRGQRGQQNDPYYNPNDPSNQPAQNDRPVLTRRRP